MPLPNDALVRLRYYGLDDPSTEATKAVLWKLLKPILKDSLADQLALTARVAPEYAQRLHPARGQIAEEFTPKLFERPFDEAWVADCRRRAELEIAMGMDARSRGSICRVLLTNLSKEIGRAFPFSGRKAAHLVEVASRIFLLDIAHALFFHRQLEVDEDKPRLEALDRAIAEFEGRMQNIGKSLNQLTALLGTTAGQLTGFAEEASSAAEAATSSADSSAQSVTSTAAATEQLSAAIEDISRRAEKSAILAKQALAQAHESNESISTLSKAVEEISSFVGEISAIAAQTNLLALNATIEAARAGAAGKGFAVVAAEVKALANQSTKATEDIARLISLIRQATSISVSKIGEAERHVAEISGVASGVAQAVDSQAAATSQIAGSVQAAAASSMTVAESLRTVEGTNVQTLEAAKSVLAVSSKLSREAAELDAAVRDLLKESSERATQRAFMDIR
jgi:methyl-accepting chemotaxis protein